MSTHQPVIQVIEDADTFPPQVTQDCINAPSKRKRSQRNFKQDATTLEGSAVESESEVTSVSLPYWDPEISIL